jgi:nucleotide-binding universal stress UspA family protein
VKKVIAAVDNSSAARTVIATAEGFAQLLGSEVEAVHVQSGDVELARREAERTGIQFRSVGGRTVEALVAEAEHEDVVLLALGARGLPHSERPIGSTALEVLTSLVKPVVVVPPEVRDSATLKRVLVPLEGTLSSSLAPKAIIELAQDAELDVVVLHVHAPDTLPAFTDQPQHQTAAWSYEFLARYCPWGLGKVSLELRVGRRAEQILAVADEVDADVIALGWSRELAVGRAPVVREVLERGHLPTLLIPVHIAPPDGRKEERWSSLQSSDA